jgi:IS30 family transposase
MDDKVNEILDRLPPKRPRSRLDPHAALIEEMRGRGRTYREIARVLAENSLVRSSPSNIYYFVKLRAREARQEKAQQARQKRAEPAGSSKSSPEATLGYPASPKILPSEVAQRIAAVKNRKPPEPSPVGFVFDPDEPLRLIDLGKQKPGD